VDADEVVIQEMQCHRAGVVVNLFAEGVRQSLYWIASHRASSAACSGGRIRYSPARRTWRTCWGVCGSQDFRSDDHHSSVHHLRLPLLAHFGHGAMSDLGPLCAPNRIPAGADSAANASHPPTTKPLRANRFKSSLNPSRKQSCGRARPHP
jgi:hypothetical protein